MKMNSTLSSCRYNESTCYFIDPNENCLTDDQVLELIEKYVIPTYYEWICIVLYVIVFLVGTIGNLLVIIVIQRNRSMRTVTNMFIMNLASADLLVLVFCLPATAIQDVTKTWFFGLIPCKFVQYIQTMSISVSVLTLMAISVERYQAIVYPLKFRGTKQRARILILSVWILSLLLVLPDAIMLTIRRQFGDRIDTIYLTYCQWDTHPLVDLIYQLHISLCLYVIPLCFMVFTYIGIVKVLWGSLPTETLLNEEKRTINSSEHTLSGHSDESHLNGPNNNSRSSFVAPTKSATLIVQEHRQKAAKMLISIVIIFAICYMPVHVFNLFRYIYEYLAYLERSSIVSNTTGNDLCFQPKPVYLERAGTINIITICALMSHILPYFNSSMNPVIYNIMSDKFRLKFRELLSSCCCCCCKSVEQMKITSSAMIPFKTSISIQQQSPVTTNYQPRASCISPTRQRLTGNSLSLSTGSGQTLLTNSKSNENHNYTHTEPVTFRLTNV